MKKTLLFLAILATSLVANATDYSFVGITADKIAAITPASSGTLTTTTLIGYLTSCPAVDYKSVPANGVMTVDLFSTPSNIQLKYNNSAAKTALFSFGANFFEADYSGVGLVLSNVAIGSVITIKVAMNNTTATFSVVGANASVSNPATINSYSFNNLVFTATAQVVTITETTGGFLMNDLNITSAVTAINTVLSDKGISFNGTEILNNKGLSIEVYDIAGKRVANSMTSISTTSFPKGIYVVHLIGLNDSLKISI